MAGVIVLESTIFIRLRSYKHGMNSKIKSRVTLLLLALVVAASGCIHTEPYAKLESAVSDKKATNSSPAEITLKASNNKDETSFYTTVKITGDGSELAKVTNREGASQNKFNLGTAERDASTREEFAQVRKKLDVDAEVDVKVKLYRDGSQEVIDSRQYTVKIKNG